MGTCMPNREHFAAGYFAALVEALTLDAIPVG